MAKKLTTYTALIEDDNGIHIYHKPLPDDDFPAFEDFDLYIQNLANAMDGEYFGPYSDDEIVEDTTMPEGPCPLVDDIDLDDDEEDDDDDDDE